jgi:methyl-accepting chemotaxis protein
MIYWEWFGLIIGAALLISLAIVIRGWLSIVAAHMTIGRIYDDTKQTLTGIHQTLTGINQTLAGLDQTLSGVTQAVATGHQILERMDQSADERQRETITAIENLRRL